MKLTTLVTRIAKAGNTWDMYRLAGQCGIECSSYQPMGEKADTRFLSAYVLDNLRRYMVPVTVPDVEAQDGWFILENHQYNTTAAGYLRALGRLIREDATGVDAEHLAYAAGIDIDSYQ